MGKTKRSGHTCCVPSCCVNGDISKIKFYRFPTRNHNLEKRAKWIKAIRRINTDGSSWEPNVNSRICSQHFVGGEKSEHPHSPAYLPTIFPEEYYGKRNDSEKKRSEAQSRFARAMRRSLGKKHLDPEKTVLLHDMDTDIQSQEPRFCEVATQVDFYEDEVNSNHMNMFSIVRDNGNTCEAGTQAEISLGKTEKKIIIPKNTAEVGCGSIVEYADKQVGPNQSDYLSLASQPGFHGFNSIENEQDLIDLAGVSFARFKSLLKVTDNCHTGAISKENMLLIFLMKMKLGLTYSSIAVFFGIHRTTVSRIFHAYSMHLAAACKDIIRWPSKFVNEQTVPDNFESLGP